MGWQGPLTHRQYVCWNEWLNFVRPNQPSPTEYYLMQVAAEQRRGYVKNPRNVKMASFRIRVTKKGAESQETRDMRIQQMKQRWIGRMTAPVTIKDGGRIVDTVVPPLVKRKQILEQQRQEAIKRKQAKQAQKKGNSDGYDGASGNRNHTERERFPLHRNVGRGKPKDGKQGK